VCAGYLLKSASAAEVAEAIKDGQGEWCVIKPEMTARHRDEFRRLSDAAESSGDGYSDGERA